MSILADRSDTLTAYETARRQLWGYVLGGAACVLIVLVAPKDLGGSLFRLGLTVIFFLGLVTMIWGAAEPLEIYLRAKLELSLEDFGTESRSIGHVVIDTFSRYVRQPVWLLLTILGLLFLMILAEWPIGAPLAPLAIIFHLAFWAALIAFPVQLFLSTHRLTEMRTLWRSFQQQIARSRFQIRTVEEAKRRSAALEGPPIVVSGPYTFQAGSKDWSWRDFQQNAIVFGQSGSGKTVTILNTLLDGLLSSADGRPGTETAAALILDPKGDYREKIDVLCSRLARSADLLILDPNRPETSVRWNPFDSPDDALEISERFAGVLQLLGMKNTQDTIWIDTAKTFIRHAVGLLRATEPSDRPPSFVGINVLATQPLLLEARLLILHVKTLLLAAGSTEIRPAELILETRVRQGMVETLREGDPQTWALQSYFRRWDRKPTAEQDLISLEAATLSTQVDAAPAVLLTPGSEALLAAEYLKNSWLTMPEKTRGSVQTQLTTMIDQFLTEPYRTLFSGRSTVKLGDVLDEGKIFYVFMPREDRSAMSRMVNALIKLEFYRQVLLRRDKTRPSLFFCDEFQNFFMSDEGRGDAAFFERSRQSFHANVVATQNLSSLLRDAPKEETVHNFLGNCAVKLFLRNTEGKTNEYAAKNVFGEYLGYVATVGRSLGGDRGGREGIREGASLSMTAQTLPVVPAERMTQLAIPDRERGVPYSEALVHLGSRAAVEIDRLRFRVHPLDA